MIRKRGDKFVLLSKTDGRVLGTHDTIAQARAQEAAITIAKKEDKKRENDEAGQQVRVGF